MDRCERGLSDGQTKDDQSRHIHALVVTWMLVDLLFLFGAGRELVPHEIFCNGIPPADLVGVQSACQSRQRHIPT